MQGDQSIMQTKLFINHQPAIKEGLFIIGRKIKKTFRVFETPEGLV
jgi:hypothetical protein